MTFFTAKQVSLSRRSASIVKDLSFSLKRGMSVAVVGPNGGGKSTLLEALAIPSSEIKIEGSLGRHGLDAKTTAYLPQQSESQRHFPLRVRDVVAGGLWHALGPLRPLGRLHLLQIEEALQVVGLSGFAFQPISALSGGQFQRVLFARVILQKAPLVLLDEPLSGLDLPTKKDLMCLIQSWQTPDNAQMVILHDLDLVHFFFPFTLILSRDFSCFGATKDVLTSENLAIAYERTQFWQGVVR